MEIWLKIIQEKVLVIKIRDFLDIPMYIYEYSYLSGYHFLPLHAIRNRSTSLFHGASPWTVCRTRSNKNIWKNCTNIQRIRVFNAFSRLLGIHILQYDYCLVSILSWKLFFLPASLVPNKWNRAYDKLF